MGDTGRLARVFVELADTLVDEFDLLDFLQILAERCVEVLPADAAGLMLTDQRGDMKLLACTPELAKSVVLAELDSGSGPSLECFATGLAITNVEPVEAQQRCALHSRVLLEQAKGMLAARAGISVSAAFMRMRSHARNRQMTMTAVATAVVNGSIDERILTGA